MPRSVAALLASALLLSSLLAAASPPLALPDAAWLHGQVDALADPAMEGRGSATPGGERAARYLARALASLGLRPGGDDRTFFQSFVVATGIRLAEAAALEPLSPGRLDLAAGRDFTPHGGSPTGEVTGDVVLAGHGVVAPEQGVDDYAGLDVRGRIVMVLAGAPARLRGPSPSRLDKLIEAHARGAAALLLVDERLPTLDATATRVDVPSATLTRDAAAAWLRTAGLGLDALEDGARRPPKAPVRARLRVALKSEDRRTPNVIGVLPGTDPRLAGEAIVVGAHYDHLGIVGGVLHPGADDNASGTALVLGLARALSASGGLPRTVVFVLFSGEELGLLGSRHYVAQAGLAIHRVAAMVNFDMVGRLNGGPLHVSGVDSGRGLREAVVETARGEPIRVALRDGPFAPSDHMRFYNAGTPVLFFFTGIHDDYHRSTDTPDKIDGAGMARIEAFAARLIERLAQGPRPQYVKLEAPERRTNGSPERRTNGSPERREAAEELPAAAPDRRAAVQERQPADPAERREAAPERQVGAKRNDDGGGRRGEAFLGVMADGRSEADGVKIAEVVPNSAAEKLGLAEGDVIVRFAGVPVNAFAELLEAVRARRPGERVQVVYLREGAAHAGSETLGARP
jgi:hypothetical protein